MFKFLAILFCFVSLNASHPAIETEEFIFIDPPFASCHASTLTQTHSGSLLCAWFAGTEEGAADVGIWLSQLQFPQLPSTPSICYTWTAPEQIVTEEGTPCWNPVLFTLPSHEILLFYKAGGHPVFWSGFLKRSSDEGKHWSQAESLPAGVIGPVKNKPLLLNGTLLCGSSIESWKRWGCWIDITTDGGRTWSKSSPINVSTDLFGIIQPTLFFGKNGSIQLLARSYQIGSICSSQSHDKGKTWSPAQPTSLPNPNSAIDAVNLLDGRILLVYNHSKKERYPLNIALSTDGGTTWQQQLTLEDQPGEYSYPSVIQTTDEKIHITYTWNRTRIKHVVLNPQLF